MTIQYLPRLLKLLLKLSDEQEDIVLDLSKVTEVDLSGLQLLCSAHKTFTEKGRKIIIDRKYPKILVKTIEDAGFLNSPIYKLLEKGGGNNV
jgi:anti-anti-sigma regulatory factor